LLPAYIAFIEHRLIYIESSLGESWESLGLVEIHDDDDDDNG
jgi:hypothetical protein